MIRYYVLIGFPAITGSGSNLPHFVILDPRPRRLSKKEAWGWACGGKQKSERPGTLNPSLRVAPLSPSTPRERDLPGVWWKHAESGTVAVLLL